MDRNTRCNFLRCSGLMVVGLILSACSAGVGSEPKDPAGEKALPTPSPAPSSATPPTSAPTPTPIPIPIPIPTPTPTPTPTPLPGQPGATSPTVNFVNPPDTAMGANLNAIVATFSEALKPDSANSSTFVVGGPQGLVGGTVSISSNGKTLTFKPNTPLAFGARYEAKLTTEIQDVAGNFLAADYVWRFNTGKQLALGSYGNHTCARLPTGALKCWGYNEFGQLGQGDTQNRGDTLNDMGTKLFPVNLGIGRSAVQVAAGVDHTCARLDNLQVKCWGDNSYGQLGIGNSVGSSIRIGDVIDEMGEQLKAVDLGAGRSALELVAGFSYTCARLDNGGVKCWGNGLGLIAPLGDGPNEMGDFLPYIALGTNRKAVALYAGWAHVCARLDDGTVKCWGRNNDGQLGLGGTAPRGAALSEMGDNLPVLDFGAFRTALHLSLGEAHTCAVLDNWSVKCWGRGTRGQLGQGGTSSFGNVPGQMGNNLPVVDIGMNRTALEISAGSEHTCARLDDGSTKCWGFNGTGQLGIGDADSRGDGLGEMGDVLPAVNLGISLHAMELVTGQSHSCARLDNNAIKCWGYNSAGQLGVGDIVTRGLMASDLGDALQAVDLGSP